MPNDAKFRPLHGADGAHFSCRYQFPVGFHFLHVANLMKSRKKKHDCKYNKIILFHQILFIQCFHCSLHCCFSEMPNCSRRKFSEPLQRRKQRGRVISTRKNINHLSTCGRTYRTAGLTERQAGLLMFSPLQSGHYN